MKKFILTSLLVLFLMGGVASASRDDIFEIETEGSYQFGTAAAIDLAREVEQSEAEDLAKRLSCEYLETSAKTGENVELAFEKIARACLETVGKG